MRRSPYFSTGNAERLARREGQAPAIAKKRARKAAPLPEPSIDDHKRWFGCLCSADRGERHRAFVARWGIENAISGSMDEAQREAASREFECATRAYNLFRAKQWSRMRTGRMCPVAFEVHKLRCMPIDVLTVRLEELQRDPPRPTAPSAENVNTEGIHHAIHAALSREGTLAWWKVVIDLIRDERRAELSR